MRIFAAKNATKNFTTLTIPSVEDQNVKNKNKHLMIILALLAKKLNQFLYRKNAAMTLTKEAAM